MRWLANSLLILACSTACLAGPPVELELATERGLQITAPQEWLQLLARIGIEDVRIRGIRSGDVPKISNVGTAQQPRYTVVGIITARDQLQLTGGTFSRSQTSQIKDYFDELAADGAESLTATRGMFDLTVKEIEAVFADLAQPINFETKGKPLRDVLNRLQTRFKARLAIDANADRIIAKADSVADELKGIAAGTGVAMMLRTNGLALRPEKHRGQDVLYHVTLADDDGSKRSPAGKTDDSQLAQWPVGWEPHGSPYETAPSLFQMLNAEIDGYTLEEALAAIHPRMKIPMFLDRPALAAHKTDLHKVQVRVPKGRTSYKRLIDRALSQGRLSSQVRVDEAGNAFLWITR